MQLPAELAHHAIRVLRLTAGTAITLFDGLGGQYGATLRIEGKTGLAEVGPHEDVEVELAGQLVLVQGIAAGDKMDWIIEKSVELGASRLVPITARRSVLQLKGARLEKRQQHWRRVAQAASEQCGRNRLMHIDAPSSLHDYLKTHSNGNKNTNSSSNANATLQHVPQACNNDASTVAPLAQTLCCHPGATAPLPKVLDRNATHISLLVGPEGGWADDELAAVDACGLATVTVGTRILRTETAGLALLAAVSALMGWL